MPSPPTHFKEPFKRRPKTIIFLGTFLPKTPEKKGWYENIETETLENFLRLQSLMKNHTLMTNHLRKIFRASSLGGDIAVFLLLREDFLKFTLLFKKNLLLIQQSIEKIQKDLESSYGAASLKTEFL